MSEPTAYELYRSGIDLLEQRDHHAAALPLRRARDLEPTTAMVREALGRALFGSQRYREAAEEFGVLVELEPVNHYAQFCLGRALQLQGLHTEARPPLTMAALLQPERADYRVYRDRTIAAIEGGAGRSGGPDASTGDAASAGTTPSTDGPAGASSSGRRRTGQGPWGAPDGDVPATDGPAGAEERHPGAGDPDDVSDGPEDLGGPPPRG